MEYLVFRYQDDETVGISNQDNTQVWPLDSWYGDVADCPHTPGKNDVIERAYFCPECQMEETENAGARICTNRECSTNTG